MSEAEATALGENKKKKGHRSGYPLYCTVARTGELFDVWSRASSLHDSNGARGFATACIEAGRALRPNCKPGGKHGACVLQLSDVGA
jgi:hypothetical protein